MMRKQVKRRMMAGRIEITTPPPRRFTLPTLPQLNWQWVAIGVLSLIVLWDNRGILEWFWIDEPAIKAGHRYQTDLRLAWADGFKAAGDVIVAGGTVTAADEALKNVATTEHQAAFAKNYAAPFSDIVSPGTEPADAATRARYAQLFYDFSAGLRRRWWFW